MKNTLLKIILIIVVISITPIMIQAQDSGIQLSETEAWFYPAKGENASGKTVLILPGGGYSHHAMDHEGHQWVPFFNQQGINVAVLKYKLPDGNPYIPLNDVKTTIKILQNRAEEWNINPKDIGIMGFSAGGHLASTYATHSDKEEKPAFQILFYPVISFQPEITHEGSKKRFLGEDQNEERIFEYSNEQQVDSSTPPAIIFHSYDDKAVAPENSINYFLALHNAGVPASLHIYPEGGHGWGIRENFPYHEAMLEELAVWLKERNAGH